MGCGGEKNWVSPRTNPSLVTVVKFVRLVTIFELVRPFVRPVTIVEFVRLDSFVLLLLSNSFVLLLSSRSSCYYLGDGNLINTHNNAHKGCVDVGLNCNLKIALLLKRYGGTEQTQPPSDDDRHPNGRLRLSHWARPKAGAKADNAGRERLSRSSRSSSLKPGEFAPPFWQSRQDPYHHTYWPQTGVVTSWYNNPWSWHATPRKINLE